MSDLKYELWGDDTLSGGLQTTTNNEQFEGEWKMLKENLKGQSLLMGFGLLNDVVLVPLFSFQFDQ